MVFETVPAWRLLLVLHHSSVVVNNILFLCDILFLLNKNIQAIEFMN